MIESDLKTSGSMNSSSILRYKTSTLTGPSIVFIYKMSFLLTNKSVPSTNCTPILLARNACSKYAELKTPGVKTAMQGFFIFLGDSDASVS